MQYFLDATVDSVFGFEASDTTSDVTLRSSRSGWGVFLEWPVGWKFFIDSPNNANGMFRESLTVSGKAGIEPVEGSFFYYGNTVGDNVFQGTFSFYNYGSGLPINDIDGWKYPGIGLIDEGDPLSLRIAADTSGAAGGWFEVTWFDSSDNPIGEPIIAGWNGDENSDWWNIILGDAPALPGLPTDNIGSALIAPPGVAYFSLVVVTQTMISGGASWGALDALYVQVGPAETPEIRSSFDTFPTGFRFPYNWRRSA